MGMTREVPPNHLGAPLVPERELLGDERVLVDAGLDLPGAVDQLLFGEVVDDELPIVGRVAPRGQPRGQVVLLAGRERDQEDELLLWLAGQAQNEIVRLHGLLLSPDRADWQVPEVLLVVEDLRVAHVVDGEHPRLDPEQPLGVTDVGPEVGRHGGERLEQPGEDPGNRADQGIRRIRDVEAHRPVVGVHGHLDSVAHVVAHPARRRRVGEPLRDGVAIQQPDEAPRGRDHQVGIVVVPEERGNPLDPLPDVPVDQHPTVRGHIVREEELGVPQVRREQQLPPERSHRNAALPRVRGIDVLVPRRVVEFFGPRSREDIIVGQLAEVEFRAGDPKIAGGHGRDVFDPELGEPLARHSVHRAHHGAVAVRIRQPLVDPDPARQVLRGKLSGRQGHLPILPIDGIAINIDVRKLVVRPDLLELAIRGEQGSGVPQADILDGRVVPLQIL